jgi:hypothetical protein
MCSPKQIHFMPEAMIPIPQQIGEKKQQDPRIPGIGKMKDRSMIIDPFEKVKEHARGEQIAEPFRNAHIDIGNRFFKMIDLFGAAFTHHILEVHQPHKKGNGKRQPI